MEKNKQQPPKPAGIPLWFYVLLLVLFASMIFNLLQNKQGKEISWDEFNRTMLQKHVVNKLTVINNETVLVYIKKEKLQSPEFKDVSTNWVGFENSGPHYFFTIGSVEVFSRQLEEAQKLFAETDRVPVAYEKSSSLLQNIFSWLVPIGLTFLLMYFIFGRMAATGGGSSIFNFGKSKAVLFDKEKIRSINFQNVAGYEEAKTEVMEVVEFLKNPSKFTKLGAKIPKGILLVGPSGTGKTLMAKAVAGEAGVPFFSLSGAEFVEMFVGVGASRVRDLFNQAKEKAPCIIFIDEIDTVGRMRGRAASFQVNDERESTLNQLLAEMDGFSADTGVIVLAATNRADVLDPALVRPGRFDRHIYLELPNKKEREAIFKIHLKGLTLSHDIDVPFLAAQTPGFSGADIANVCNEAALIAARSQKASVELSDFMNAIDRMVAGLEKKTKVISPAEKKIISIHESGHALVGWKLEHVDPLVKVSIIPRGKSLGSAWYLPEERQILTESQLFDGLCVMLGGRAAEELIFKEVSSGALDDLEKATKQAYLMVSDLGLSSKLPNISYYDSTGVRESSLQKPYSEKVAATIDDEVQSLLTKAYSEAKKILTENERSLRQLAQRLEETEILNREDLEKILGRRTAEKPAEKIVP